MRNSRLTSFLQSRSLFIMIILLIISLICTPKVYAVDLPFDTENISSQDGADEMKAFHLQKTETISYSNQIHTFAVNKNGHVAIGFYDKSAVNVFDNKGEYLFTYLFSETEKRAYSIEWIEDSLAIIMWGHNKRLVLIDTNVNSISIKKIQMTDDFNSYLIQVHNVTAKEENDFMYEMRNGMSGLLSFMPKQYTQVVKTDESGKETVVFDVSELASKQAMPIVIGIVVILCLIIIAVLFLLIRWKKKK